MIAVLIGANFKLLELALQPVIMVLKVFAEIMDGYTEIIEVVNIVLKSLIKTIQDFIKTLFMGFDIKDVLELVRKVMMKLIEALLVFIATVYKIFGMDAALNDLIEGLKPKPGATAAGQAAFKDFQSVAKDMALAAAMAAGAAGQTKKFDLSDVVTRLEQIRDTQLQGMAKDIHDVLDTVKQILAAMPHPPKPDPIGAGNRAKGLGAAIWDNPRAAAQVVITNPAAAIGTAWDIGKQAVWGK